MNSDTRMNRRIALDRRHVLAVRIDDDLGFGQLVLAAPGDQPHRAVGQRVRTHSASRP